MNQLRYYIHTQNNNISLSLLKRIVYNFFTPSDSNLIGAFAYGSVAFSQHGRPSSDAQLDLIFIVRDPVRWHHTNRMRYPQHYSALMKHVPHSCLDKVLSTFPGPQIYYNPLVDWFDEVEQLRMSLKYGVVRFANVISDLINWSHLYIAGRLHKPVLWIPVSHDLNNELERQLVIAQEKNLYSALCYGLLQLLPNDFVDTTEFDLFHIISALSYEGDWRMLLGEDKQKVSRIVTGSDRLSRFRELYHNAISQTGIGNYLHLVPIAAPNQTGAIHQLSWSISPHSPECVKCLLDGLPDNLCVVAAQLKRGCSFVNALEARIYLAQLCSHKRQLCLRKSVKHTVGLSSVYQTLLGLLTAGPIRSVVYASVKFKKMLASMGLKRWN